MQIASKTHNVLGDSGQSEDKTRANRDEEHGGDLSIHSAHARSRHHTRRECTHVQGKGHTGVGDEDEEADAVEGVERLETLSEGDDDGVDDGADGGVVVERDDGVHLTGVSEDAL